jgi:hypothetical protein
MHEVALINLSEFIHLNNIKLLHGRIIEPEHLGWFDHSCIELDKDEHARLWYVRDTEELELAPNIIDQLPRNIDLLILDGGEYTTYPEFHLLVGRCRYIILDDTKTHKCSKLRTEIFSQDIYEVLIDEPEDRNGWMLIHRRGLT